MSFRNVRNERGAMLLFVAVLVAFVVLSSLVVKGLGLRTQALTVRKNCDLAAIAAIESYKFHAQPLTATELALWFPQLLVIIEANSKRITDSNFSLEQLAFISREPILAPTLTLTSGTWDFTTLSFSPSQDPGIVNAFEVSFTPVEISSFGLLGSIFDGGHSKITASAIAAINSGGVAGLVRPSS